jgi:hypothetical protein
VVHSGKMPDRVNRENIVLQLQIARKMLEPSAGLL